MGKEDSKERILAAAIRDFAQKGFANTSMNDIVRASGLSKGGVYWHFESKDAIVEAVFDQFFSEQAAQTEAILAQDGRAADKLKRIARAAGQQAEMWLAQFPSPMEFYALAVRDTSLSQTLRRYFVENEIRLAELIELGIADGQLRPVDAGQTAIALTGLFEGLLLLWVIDPQQFDFAAQVEAAVDLLLDGLGNQQERDNA